MPSLFTPPHKSQATIAEIGTTLICATDGNDAALQEITQRELPIYPSIQFKPMEGRNPDHVGFNAAEQLLCKIARPLIEQWQLQWEINRPLIEESPFYKVGKIIYDTVNDHFLRNHPLPTEHHLFNATPAAIPCMAWHPHKEILAIANRNHDVYIYEREKSQWTCKVLKHKFMIDITALAWKPKAGGTLAVGCRYGVCVWNFTAESAPLQSPQKGVQIKSASSSTMRYHPNAWMKYLRTDGHEHIASLTWDPSPGSHLLAAVSANNSTLMIYDTLTLTGTPLKRYGKGNLLVRWSPDGDWLYVATSTGSIRIWETEHWTSTTYTNPPGLWVQAACWAPDSRSLFYSMRGKSDVHLLYRSGPSINAGVWDVKVLSAPATTATVDKEEVPLDGVIKDISLDATGQRLAVAFENTELIGLYALKEMSPLKMGEDCTVLPIGYIRGSQTAVDSSAENRYEITPMSGTKPLHIAFAPSYKNGALLATVWDNNTISFVTHAFVSNDSARRR